MMQINIDIPIEGNRTPFWQHDGLTATLGTDEANYVYALGIKTFISIGKFEYDWPLQYLTREDVQAIVDAGQRLLDITKEA